MDAGAAVHDATASSTSFLETKKDQEDSQPSKLLLEDAMASSSTTTWPESLSDSQRALMEARNSYAQEPVQLSQEYVQMCVDHFQPHRRLGEGAFGQVFLGHDPTLQLDMAIKKVPLRILDQKILSKVHLSFRTEIAVRNGLFDLAKVYCAVLCCLPASFSDLLTRH